MPLPTREVDLVAYDQLGQPILLAEVKSTHGTSNEWAARFRSNLLAHGTLPPAPFFLIATPDHMYFWRQQDPTSEEEPPQFTMDATHELKPYFDRFKQTPEKTGGPSVRADPFFVASRLSPVRTIQSQRRHLSSLAIGIGFARRVAKGSNRIKLLVMNVYVESNFVLEQALEQEQSESCQRLISLAVAGSIRLLIPAFSLVEPHISIMHKANERFRLSTELKKEPSELGRSKPTAKPLAVSMRSPHY